jgi:hypothetical protein
MSDYRKLPGRRRGFLKGASVWLGPDHLLSVKSLRFREEYKRFHLRDIQAIVVARGARFLFSTPDGLIVVLWLAVYFAARGRAPWVSPVLWAAAAGLAGSWLYVSIAHGCTCRIHTAVSRDPLPSIYRTWTAHKFLDQVEPLISQVQGVVEGNWVDSVVVPSHPLPPLLRDPAPTPVPGRSHTLASDLFVASLFADAALNLLTLYSTTRTSQWVWYGLAVAEVAGAIFIFLEHRRGILRAGLQKLAIAALITLGAVFYLKQILAGVAMGNRPIMPDPAVLAALPSFRVLREVDAGVCLVLGLIGAALIVMPRQDSV